MSGGSRLFPRFVWSVLLVLQCALPAQAENLDLLYEASVPVLDQSERERQRALTLALEQVLVRTSGQDLDVLRSLPEWRAVLAKAEDSLLEYRYGAPKATTPAPAPTGYLLVARFSPPGIRQLLARSGLALWPRTRPTIMVWWLVEEKGQRRLVSGDPLLAEAVRRGLPVVFPMNDRQDNQLHEGLWNFQPEALAQVRERYGTGGILVGRAVADAQGWRGQWLFDFQGQSFMVPAPTAEGLSPWAEAEVLPDLAALGVSTTVQTLLPLYAIDLNAPAHSVDVLVSGVSGFPGYSEVTRYLQGQEAVRRASLRQVKRDTLVFQVEYDGQLSVLRQLFSLGNVFHQPAAASAVDAVSPGGDTAVTPVLTYRYGHP